MHKTKIRPRTEPYEFWAERRRIQTKEIDRYLKYGTPVWRSCVLLDKRADQTHPPQPHDLKKFKISGTYVMPNCPLCGKKEKRCICLEDKSWQI